jgi:hypothetical protein
VRKLRSDALTWNIVGDDVVVLDLAGSVYLQLSGSGRVVWEALAEPRTDDELVELLCARYGIDGDVARADVASFIADLERRGLLEG